MNADLLLKHFDLLTETSENIPALRKLIVSLAVAGKFTSTARCQTPESLRAQFTTRASLSKLHRDQLLRPIDAEELPEPNMNPNQFVRMAAIAAAKKGLTGIQGAQPGPFPLVVTAKARSTCAHFDYEGAAAIIPLVSSAGHGKASLNRLHYQEGKFALGNILCAVFPYVPEHFSARFLYEYLTAFKDELLVSKMIGTANVSLTVGKINDIPIPLIPVQVQTLIDELMALCDQLEAAQAERERRRDRLAAASLHRLNQPADDAAPELFRAHAHFYINHLPRLTTRPDQIKQLRQTILNLAVRGKLVPQYSNEESATVVIKRIQTEMALPLEKGRIKAGDSITEIEAARAPFYLPSGWSWAHFPQIGVFGRGKSKHRPRNDKSLFRGGTHFFVQTGDVARSNGVIRTYTSKYNDIGLAQSVKWPAGTLCITIAANIAASGILSFDACFPDSVVGFVPKSEFPDAKYFEYFVRTARADLSDFAPATAQKNINLEILNAVLVPVPPPAEQERIVGQLDTLMALCDDLEAYFTATQIGSRNLFEAAIYKTLANPVVGKNETWKNVFADS